MSLHQTTSKRKTFEADQRRVTGGTIYRDLLWILRDKEERRTKRFLDRIVCEGISETDRKIFAEEVVVCQEQIGLLFRLLTMKEPGSDE